MMVIRFVFTATFVGHATIARWHDDPVFFLIGIVGGGVQLGSLGTAATNGQLCQPRVIMMMEKLVQ
jgi:hypothetical protein